MTDTTSIPTQPAAARTGHAAGNLLAQHARDILRRLVSGGERNAEAVEHHRLAATRREEARRRVDRLLIGR